MWNSQGVWFVVASRDSARLIVRVTATGKYETLWAGGVSALYSGNASRGQKPRFGSLIAKLLNEACARNLIQGLVLVVPRRLRRIIREGLDPAASSRIIVETSENLGRLHDYELVTRLAGISLSLPGAASEPTNNGPGSE